MAFKSNQKAGLGFCYFVKGVTKKKKPPHWSNLNISQKVNVYSK